MSASRTAAPEILVAADRDEHAALAAELCARGIAEAIDARGVARVALSGGTTPAEAYRRLSSLSLRWDRVEWYWVDERAVDPSSPRSNHAAASRDLGLEGGARGKAFRMKGEAADLAATAREYEALLRKAFGIAGAAAFDVITLGIGDDGHTASLFPGLGVTKIDDRLVAAIPEQPQKQLEARLTLTAPVLAEARLAVVLARGESKRAPVAAAMQAGSTEEIPARILLGSKGRVVWVLDKEAAG